MTLDDIADTNPTARKMRIAAKRGNIAAKAQELTKGRSEDRRNTANYDSGVNMNSDDSPITDNNMGGGEDFSS
jgi:hypothetical protein